MRKVGLLYLLMLLMNLPIASSEAIKIVTTTRTPNSSVSSTHYFAEIHINVTELGTNLSAFHLVNKNALELIKEDPTLDEVTRRGLIWYELNWRSMSRKAESPLPVLLQTMSVSDQLRSIHAR
jgi:hypothetical protein